MQAKKFLDDSYQSFKQNRPQGSRLLKQFDL